jgi:hypothetical protein
MVTLITLARPISGPPGIGPLPLPSPATIA